MSVGSQTLDGMSGRRTRNAAVVVFIATLLWSPFPLGGAIRWAPAIQQILIVIAWILWVLGTARSTVLDRRYRRLAVIPTGLFCLSLGWAIIQITPATPSSWVHPVWGMAGDILGQNLKGTISLNPWRTEAEILNLASYVLAGALVFGMARRIETANLLLNAIIAVTALYALYAFALALSGVQQVNVFYSVPYKNPLISGPFMLHNSFATYCGLGSLAALARLCAGGSRSAVVGRGWRRLAESVMQYCFSSGALILIGFILNFSGVIASASRAGFASTLLGLATLALLAFAVARGRTNRTLAGLGGLTAAAPIVLILIVNGGTLGSRIGELLASDAGDQIRFALWASARRMIADAPLLGLGLGTFEDSYPLYAAQIFSNVMDKAHCDYLEFAAGIGIPAAIGWWLGLLWLCGANLRAIFVRHRNRVFSSIGVAATVLVAFHSLVDFSLQLPAVALIFTTLLAIGSSQSLGTAKA